MKTLKILAIVLGVGVGGLILWFWIGTGGLVESSVNLHNALTKPKVVEELKCGSLRVQHVYQEIQYAYPDTLIGIHKLADSASYHKLRILNGNAEATLTITGNFQVRFRSTNPGVRMLDGKSVAGESVFTPFERAHLVEVGHASGLIDDSTATVEEKVASTPSYELAFVGLPQSLIPEPQFKDLQSCAGFPALVERIYAQSENRALYYFYLLEK